MMMMMMLVVDVLQILAYSLQFYITNYLNFHLLQIQMDVNTRDGNDKCLQNFNQKPEAEQFGSISNVSNLYSIGTRLEFRLSFRLF
jgi:hypothetical protein